jgi:type II secretory pathway component PulC
MAENNSSAEHELLRAIEGKASLAPRFSENAGEAKDKLVHAFEDLKKRFSNIDFSGKLNIADVSRVLAVLAVLLVLFQMGILARGFLRIGNIPTFDKASALKATGEARKIELPLKEYSYYSDTFMDRNIFLEKKEEAAAVEVPGTSEFDDISRKLRLTGISWLEEPGEKFAMIEDTEIKVTYYLQEQETLKGFTVESIGSNRVVLKKDGRELELR